MWEFQQMNVIFKTQPLLLIIPNGCLGLSSRKNTANLNSHELLPQSALKNILCPRSPNYGKGDKTAVTSVVSGNIYLARQLFFILLTIICVSKIQIIHSDKSGSRQ